MNVLVIGGAGSGKSAYAERLAAGLSTTRTYLATMRNEGSEANLRIRRHQQQRRDLGFATIECPHTLPTAERLGSAQSGVVLLDDLGNLAANTLFSPDEAMGDPSHVLEQLERQIARLFTECAHVVVVGNEVGCEGLSPYEGTRVWVELMGALCCRTAAHADAVVEVVTGVPHIIKGAIA